MALAMRGECVKEIVDVAVVMRARSISVRAPADAIDVVGTGGGKGTLNISTAAAIVMAGCDAPVAEHGNRALSSRSGAADALGALGVGTMVTAGVAQRALATRGLCFMMAPMHHASMRHVQPVRREMGVRTVFNILGPLTNPAWGAPTAHGCLQPLAPMPDGEDARLARVANGLARPWRGNGTDELSIAGPSQVVALTDGKISAFEVCPADAGLPTHRFEAIRGDTPQRNAQALADLLDGAPGAYRDAVLLNAAAALVVAGRTNSLAEGASLAASSVDDGAARAKLAALADVTSPANMARGEPAPLSGASEAEVSP
ncbi:anthranilate phosphoribosyltransferase [Acuticoccus sp.]|uniref:anthranilate phosphoribosyltransferase n=1 Tax=Acuticoccus sp. TaxID=1904378 RepID=UPI003B52FB78